MEPVHGTVSTPQGFKYLKSFVFQSSPPKWAMPSPSSPVGNRPIDILGSLHDLLVTLSYEEFTFL